MNKLSIMFLLSVSALFLACPPVGPEEENNQWLEIDSLDEYDIASGLGASGALNYPETDAEVQDFMAIVAQEEASETGIMSQLSEAFMGAPAPTGASRGIHTDPMDFMNAIMSHFDTLLAEGQVSAEEFIAPQTIGSGLELLAFGFEAESSILGTYMNYNIPDHLSLPLEIDWDGDDESDLILDENGFGGVISPALKAKGLVAFKFTPDTPGCIKEMGLKIAAGVDGNSSTSVSENFEGYVVGSGEEITYNTLNPPAFAGDYAVAFQLAFVVEHLDEGGTVIISGYAKDNLDVDMAQGPEAFMEEMEPETMGFQLEIIKDDLSSAYTKSFDTLEELLAFITPEAP
jgi:hypothetical protein